MDPDAVEHFFEQQRKATNRILSIFLQSSDFTTDGLQRSTVTGQPESRPIELNETELSNCNGRLLSNGRKSYDNLLQKLQKTNCEPLEYNLIRLLAKTIENYEDTIDSFRKISQETELQAKKSSQQNSYQRLNPGGSPENSRREGGSPHGGKGSNLEASTLGQSIQRNRGNYTQYSGATIIACLDTLRNLNLFYSPASVTFNLDQLKKGTSVLFDDFLKAKLMTKSLLKGQEKETGQWVFDELEKTFRIYYEEREALKLRVDQTGRLCHEKDLLVKEVLDKMDTFHTSEIVEANKELLNNRKLFVEKEVMRQEALDDKDKELQKNMKYQANLLKKVQDLRSSVKIIQKRNKLHDRKEFAEKSTQMFQNTHMDFKIYKKETRRIATDIGFSALVSNQDMELNIDRAFCDSITSLYYNYLSQNSQSNNFVNVMNQYNLTNDIFNYNDWTNMGQNFLFNLGGNARTGDTPDVGLVGENSASKNRAGGATRKSSQGVGEGGQQQSTDGNVLSLKGGPTGGKKSGTFTIDSELGLGLGGQN